MYINKKMEVFDYGPGQRQIGSGIKCWSSQSIKSSLTIPLSLILYLLLLEEKRENKIILFLYYHILIAIELSSAVQSNFQQYY